MSDKVISKMDRQRLRNLHAGTSQGRWRNGDGIAPKIFLYGHPDRTPVRPDDIFMLGETYADVPQQGRRNMKFIAEAHDMIPDLLDYIDYLEQTKDSVE